MARQHRKTRAPTREQLEERFSTEGKDFKESRRRVLAGGRGDDERPADEGEGDRMFKHIGREVADEATKERARRKFADPAFRARTAELRAEALADREARDARKDV